jgi:hypothetical protein
MVLCIQLQQQQQQQQQCTYTMGIIKIKTLIANIKPSITSKTSAESAVFACESYISKARLPWELVVVHPGHLNSQCSNNRIQHQHPQYPGSIWLSISLTLEVDTVVVLRKKDHQQRHQPQSRLSKYYQAPSNNDYSERYGGGRHSDKYAGKSLLDLVHLLLPHPP